MEKCVICGGELTVFKDKPYDYPVGGLQVTLLGIPQHTCNECGEEFTTIPNPEALHKMIGLEICKNKKGLLLPEEIVFLRKELSLNAIGLAKVLGVTPSSLSRWENGKKTIGEGNDRMLRMSYISCFDEPCSKDMKCDKILSFLSNLPQKRKAIKGQTTISINPQEWLVPNPVCC